jgi:hypothetical protein
MSIVMCLDEHNWNGYALALEFNNLTYLNQKMISLGYVHLLCTMYLGWTNCSSSHIYDIGRALILSKVGTLAIIGAHILSEVTIIDEGNVRTAFQVAFNKHVKKHRRSITLSIVGT